MQASPQLIFNHFTNLSDLQKQHFEKLFGIYAEINQRVNLISRKDIDSFYEKHVLHSLSIAKIVSFVPGTKILDIGTGGGFPGIPLAIMFPECTFHLMDSINKKILAVKEVVETLDLQNCTAETNRCENHNKKYDFVTCRAVAPAEKIIGWTKNNIHGNNNNSLKNGWLLIKGGDLKQELKETQKKYTEYNLYDLFKTEFFETKKLIHIPFKL